MHTPAAADANRHQSQLLDLPYNIRRGIYGHLFCGPNDINICDSEQILTGKKYTQRLPVQFLRTCRQVSLEAVAVLYASNRFVVSERRHRWCEVDQILGFLRHIGVANQGHMRTLEIDWVVGFENAMQRVAGMLDSSQGPSVESLRLAVRDFVGTTSSQISETIKLLNSNFNSLKDLTLCLPGYNAGRLDLGHYHSLHGYFENPATEPLGAHISLDLRKLKELQKLSVGNTTDFDFFEREAHAIGVQHLVVFWTEHDEVNEGVTRELEGRRWFFDFRERAAHIPFQRESHHHSLSTLPRNLSRPNFLDLPPEIRQMIYRELLIPGLVIPYRSRGSGQGLLQGTGLLLTSRQISQEACAVLYSCNRFYLFAFASGYPLLDSVSVFLNSIGPSNRSLIRRLSLDFSTALRRFFDDVPGIGVLLPPYPNYSRAEEFVGSIRESLSKIESSIGDVLEILGRERHDLDYLWLATPHGHALRILVNDRENILGLDHEYFASSVIQNNLRRIEGVKKLTLWGTTDFIGLEECAREMGVRELKCGWDEVGFAEEELVEPPEGWILVGGGRAAVKTLS
ncbi:hypothetical protein GP486_005676 [Trichoglossum hirsutum]|uniref:F-box domain-containing protein n=1 Tax=Trichoglossum hirsutum TaxID=265104 RepID=A0A9P8RLT0_9PEZI|nr:hypothetical protein GP486_005676 [Trichoglossum hirsutum]